MYQRKETPMARYSEYPAFQERLRALEEERRTQKQALLATAEAHLQSGDALQFDQEAWSATFDQIDATIEQQILEAHAHYQVPILQAWDQALQTTGKARYHDEYSLPGQHMQ